MLVQLGLRMVESAAGERLALYAPARLLDDRLDEAALTLARRASALHFNMVRVWMLGGNGLQNPGEMYLAGFSMSFKRR